MTRENFLAELRRGLSVLPPADIDYIIADYQSHFTDARAAGRSESEIIDALGDPARLARELRAEAGFRRWEQERSAGNFLGLVLALLGLATLDVIVMFPLLCAAAGVFFGFAVASLALCVGGVFLLFNLLPVGWHPRLGSVLLQSLIGIGIAAGGVSAGAVLLLLLDGGARLLMRYARLHYRLLHSANASIPG